MGGLGRRIIDAVANPIHNDRCVEPMRGLAEALGLVGLNPLCGGEAADQLKN
jgi:hypothetical protein